MNLADHSRYKIARLLDKLLLVGLCALLAAPAAIAQTLPRVPAITPAGATSVLTPVSVDQQPLTIRPQIEPNIMLMLDDSGSMEWDYMPDWSYISDNSDNGMRDSSINGTYYNPDVIYSPPPLADGGSFPDSPGLTDAYTNGFDTFDSSTGKIKTDLSSINTTDVTQFDVDYPYYTQFDTDVTVGEKDPSPGCADGDDYYPYYGECYHDGGYTTTWYKRQDHKPHCADGDKSRWHDGETMCRHREYTDSKWYDPSINYPYCPEGKYNDATKKCDVTENRTVYLFTYTHKNSDGTFATHFVAKDVQDCSAAAIKYPDSDCDYTADSQQNVANWFSYYRTRILLAKSGLMNAFSGLNSTYRFGFGSLHNNGGFPSGIDLWCDSSYSCSRTDSSSGYQQVLATVQPFGDGSSLSDQKNKFWHWIVDVTPNNGTPLRSALQSVGDYYQTKQPWESPDGNGGTQTLACRQSYTIMTTDGFWNSGSTDVENADGSGSYVDTDWYRDENGNWQDTKWQPTDNKEIKGPNNLSFTYAPHDPFQDDNANTLADVAMYYWNHDLQSDINNEVPTNDSDHAFWQHMVTFTIGMGFLPQYQVKGSGTASMTSDIVDALFDWAKSGVQPKSLTNWGGWLTPDSGNGNGILNNINDLVHAAINGHGGFYSATDPLSFATGLKGALDRASERTGSGASLAANSTQLKTGTMAYQAIYHTVKWTGELKAFVVNPVNGKLALDATWNAADVMPSAADRSIYTYNPEAGTYLAFKDNGSVPPRTPPALSSDELTALGSDSATQAAMVDYLRGDDTANDLAWRQRDSSLGDIVDSQPVYVGEVNANQYVGRSFTGSDKFAQYASDQQSREGHIYVAANDGMLHGFDASNGKEAYAYLPAAVIAHGSTTGGISQFADVNYGNSDKPHQYFNDGQLTVADAYFDTGTGAAWHTVLVGTTGRGAAKAVYALDVTDPDNVKFLWERSAFTSAAKCPDCDYIGQMTGKPIIAQVADGDWAVLIGNGYNSAKGQAALLQFSLANGSLTVHQGGTDTANGLSSPAIWIGDVDDNISTVAYAGDLLGHVWSFQLSTMTKKADGTYTVTSTPSTAGTLLFTTTDGTTVQPITAGMLVGSDPDTGNLWLFFGTGRYLSANDITNTHVQSWYGLIVHVNASDQTLVDNLTKNGRSALVQRSIIAQFPGSTVKNADGTTTITLPTRVVTTADGAPSLAGKSGWYIDLETPIMNADGTSSGHTAEGERMITPNQFQGSRLVATSIVPKSTDLCNPSGTGWIMAVEPFLGTNPKPQFYDVNGDGVINSADMVTIAGKSYAAAGVSFSSLPNAPIFVGGAMLTSFDNGTTSSTMTSGAGGTIQRVSWREMANP